MGWAYREGKHWKMYWTCREWKHWEMYWDCRERKHWEMYWDCRERGNIGKCTGTVEREEALGNVLGLKREETLGCTSTWH